MSAVEHHGRQRLTPIGALLGPKKWLVEDLIPAGALIGTLELDYEAVRSYVALDLALHVAAGRPWGERATTPGAVVFAAGLGAANFPERIKVACEVRGLPTNIPFHLLPGVTDPAEIRAAIDEAGLCPALVVIETPYGMNNKAFAKAVRSLGDSAVLVVDHDVVKGADIGIRVRKNGVDFWREPKFGEEQTFYTPVRHVGGATVVPIAAPCNRPAPTGQSHS